MPDAPLCDKCGEPVLPDDLHYTGADRLDDDGRHVGARHSTCQQKARAKYEEDRARAPELLKQATDLLSSLTRNRSG